MKRILSVCVLVLVSASSQAKWTRLPLEEAVNRSDLIVHGVLSNIERTGSNDVVFCKGTLQIKETFKGTLTNSVVLAWSFRPKVSDQTDHTPWRRMEMIWILTRATHGEYYASHPVMVQPMSKSDDILAILKGNTNTPSQGIPRPAGKP